MSNEEAIKILKEVREEVLAKETELSKQVFENLGIKAIDLAIKALEQQQEPSEDCISRQVVKEMLTETWTKYMPMELDINLSFVLEKISELPSVTPSYNSVKTELKSSDDCISRQEVLDGLDRYIEKAQSTGTKDDFISFKELVIKQLPSVIPSIPHGEWIHFTDDFKDYVACSCCGYGEDGEVLLEDKTPFCPVCGADMREVQDEDSD